MPGFVQIILMLWAAPLMVAFCWWYADAAKSGVSLVHFGGLAGVAAAREVNVLAGLAERLRQKSRRYRVPEHANGGPGAAIPGSSEDWKGQPLFTSGHSPLSIGRKASSPGMVRISL